MTDPVGIEHVERIVNFWITLAEQRAKEIEKLKDRIAAAEVVVGAMSMLIADMRGALQWGDKLYAQRSLLANPVAGVELHEGPGAWINRVRELLRK